MPIRLSTAGAGFSELFTAFLGMKREVNADIEAATRAIVDDVAARGDAALLEATAKFDRLKLDASGLRVTLAEVDAAVAVCDRETVDALKFARSCQRMSASPTRSASNWAGAGAPSRRLVFMSPAARRPIRPRC
jgi:histidinol dehydrogenase